MSQRRSSKPKTGRSNVTPSRSTPRHTSERPTNTVVIPPATRRIEQITQVLGEVLQWTHPADQCLSYWMRNQKKMGGRDRAEVTNAVFAVLRHLRLFRQAVQSFAGSNTRALAILGLSTVAEAEYVHSGLNPEEQAWLEHAQTLLRTPMAFELQYSLPDWLAEAIQQLPEPEALAAALNQEAPLDLRVNTLKSDRETVLASLRHKKLKQFKFEVTPYSPWGIRVSGRPFMGKWPEYVNGELEVQDEGSQLLTALLAPKRGEMVIDFCAGAGGKTLLLGALMRNTGRLYAFDVSAARLARAKPRFARSGLSNVVSVVVDEQNDTRVKRLRGKAQRVLVDAPCSGLGTLRRNPDLKWRQHPDSLTHYIGLQADILKRAARCVAPGGRLVYSTCSVLPQENEAQVEAFLAEHPDFYLVPVNELLEARIPNLTMSDSYLRLRPDMHGTDGFFAAVLDRKPLGS